MDGFDNVSILMAHDDLTTPHLDWFSLAINEQTQRGWAEKTPWAFVKDREAVMEEPNENKVPGAESKKWHVSVSIEAKGFKRNCYGTGADGEASGLCGEQNQKWLALR